MPELHRANDHVTATNRLAEPRDVRFLSEGTNRWRAIGGILQGALSQRQCSSGECMKQRWYVFTDWDSGYGTCGWQQYRNPSCYKPQWELTLKSILSRLGPEPPKR